MQLHLPDFGIDDKQVAFVIHKDIAGEEVFNKDSTKTLFNITLGVGYIFLKRVSAINTCL